MNSRIIQRIVAILTASVLCCTVFAASHAQNRLTWHGIRLPDAESPGVPGPQPPTAWLIAGRRAVPATFGSYCYGNVCADSVAPFLFPRISSAIISPYMNLVVVVDAHRLRSYQADVMPWHVRSAGTVVPIRHHHFAGYAALTLGRLHATRDQALEVFVSFPRTTPTTDTHISGGDVVYYWRLEPAGATRSTASSPVPI